MNLDRLRIDPMSEDLRRQRRNIILISFILCFMKYGGIQITKTSVLGAEVQFNNASAIFFGIWLIWIYFLIRYYQYFMQEGLRNIMISLTDNLTDKCRPVLKSVVKSEHPEVQIGSQTFDYNVHKKKNWYTIEFIATEPKHTKGHINGFDPIQFNMLISFWKLRTGIIKSWIKLIFNQSVMTDYLFPILFALFTVIYCNIGNWPGALKNVF